MITATVQRSEVAVTVPVVAGYTALGAPKPESAVAVAVAPVYTITNLKGTTT